MEPGLREAVAVSLRLVRIELADLAVDKTAAVVEPARGSVDRFNPVDQIREVAAEPAVKHADRILLRAVGGTRVEHMPAIGRCRKAVDRHMLAGVRPGQRVGIDEHAVGAGVGLAHPEPGHVFIGRLLEKEDVAIGKPLGLGHGEGRGPLEVADAGEQTLSAGNRREDRRGCIGLLPQPPLHVRIVKTLQMPMLIGHGRAEVFADDRICPSGRGRRGFPWSGSDAGEEHHGEP